MTILRKILTIHLSIFFFFLFPISFSISVCHINIHLWPTQKLYCQKLEKLLPKMVFPENLDLLLLFSLGMEMFQKYIHSNKLQLMILFFFNFIIPVSFNRLPLFNFCLQKLHFKGSSRNIVWSSQQTYKTSGISRSFQI